MTTSINYNNIYVIFQANVDKNSFSFDMLRNELNDLGLEEKNIEDGTSNPKFVWFRYITTDDSVIRAKYYKTPIYCISVLDNNSCITDKYLLYNNMNKLYPDEVDDFMAPSFKLALNTKYIPNNIYIARPVNNLKTNLRAASGLDVIVYNSEKTLNDAKKLLYNYDKVIVSNYITNPLLFKGKKFHLRTYMIVTLFNGVFSSYMFDLCRFMLSKDKFVNNNYQNKNIHDTHYRHNDDDYIFPVHFTSKNINKNIKDEDIIIILYKIKDICYKMSEIYSREVKLMYNSQNGFHIFGFDIMIDNNLNPILIECNRYQNTGLDYNNEMKVLFEKYFLDWIINIVIRPLFQPEIKIQPSFITTPIYKKIL